MLKIGRSFDSGSRETSETRGEIRILTNSATTRILLQIVLHSVGRTDGLDRKFHLTAANFSGIMNPAYESAAKTEG
jgi:hypothetical protein